MTSYLERQSRKRSEMNILKGPIPNKTALTSVAEHDVWCKYSCDVEDFSKIISDTIIIDPWKEPENL